MTTSKKVKISLVLPPALYEMLKVRSERNQRSFNGEAIFLIETGLAQKSDQIKDTLHMLLKASGGDYPSDISHQE